MLFSDMGGGGGGGECIYIYTFVALSCLEMLMNAQCASEVPYKSLMFSCTSQKCNSNVYLL